LAVAVAVLAVLQDLTAMLTTNGVVVEVVVALVAELHQL
jgi:hypothetical protein